MNHWFTRRGAKVRQDYLKRFDPAHWTVDFPRGAIASAVRGMDAHSMDIACEFLREDDLVGLIWSSEDLVSHPAHARETARDYAGVRLSFRWQSSGMMPLDLPNGATLTIEGRDEAGQPRSWYVRLWNYAQGSGEDATISIDFDALDAGYSLPVEADRVHPRDIDRMFVSLVPSDYVAGSSAFRSSIARASVAISDVICRGSGSVIDVGSSLQPANGFGICTAYDDHYHVEPARLIEAAHRLGYQKTINHYVGMSHYMALGGDGKVDPTRVMNDAALDWHRGLAREAARRGYEVIWSLSYEIFDEFCPADWKQRDASGNPALTGWEPPSTLVSPASCEAIAYLSDLAVRLVGIAQEAGLTPRIQVGEPWWWINGSGQPCLYDQQAVASWGGNPPIIETIYSQGLSQGELGLLDAAGTLLAQSTAAIGSAAKAADPETEFLLLAFLPTILDQDAPEARRANLPVEWSAPAFDRLQVEDYEWVTRDVSLARRLAARDEIDARLGYSRSEQHYFAGFATDAASARRQWPSILSAADEAKREYSQTFVWALPQVMRDGLVIFGKDDEMEAFADVSFPIAIGSDASVAPAYSTRVVTGASGHEFRNANWSSARMQYDAGPGVRSEEEMEILLSFFRARRGSAQAFRFRDPYDHSSNGMTGAPTATDQNVGEGDGVTTRFALSKAYGEDEQRPITRPVASSVRVALDGVELQSGWSLEEKGHIAFDLPPAAGVAIAAGFLFDVPVRFSEDRLEINRASFLAGEAPSVPLVEVRE